MLVSFLFNFFSFFLFPFLSNLWHSCCICLFNFLLIFIDFSLLQATDSRQKRKLLLTTNSLCISIQTLYNFLPQKQHRIFLNLIYAILLPPRLFIIALKSDIKGNFVIVQSGLSYQKYCYFAFSLPEKQYYKMVVSIQIVL